MRHHRLFAAGIAAALMLGGAAAPALAKPGKANGHAYGKNNTKPAKPEKPAKPAKKAKKTKAGVSGGGAVGTADFSIQARQRSTDKGHFNYTDGATTKVRCRGGFTSTTPVTVGTETTVDVTFTACSATGITGSFPLTVTVVDRGEPSVTPPVTDRISFQLPGAATPLGGELTGGNVKVRV